MDTASVVVITIIVNSLILACMAGIVGYTVGRARAVKKISKEEEILFSYRDIIGSTPVEMLSYSVFPGLKLYPIPV